jgi:hypothetical protein
LLKIDGTQTMKVNKSGVVKQNMMNSTNKRICCKQSRLKAKLKFTALRKEIRPEVNNH